MKKITKAVYGYLASLLFAIAMIPVMLFISFLGFLGALFGGNSRAAYEELFR